MFLVGIRRIQGRFLHTIGIVLRHRMTLSMGHHHHHPHVGVIVPIMVGGMIGGIIRERQRLGVLLIDTIKVNKIVCWFFFVVICSDFCCYIGSTHSSASGNSNESLEKINRHHHNKV